MKKHKPENELVFFVCVYHGISVKFPSSPGLRVKMSELSNSSTVAEGISKSFFSISFSF